MEPIRVNQAEISPAAIAAEMQYHPAGNRENAWQAAATALVVQQLLVQEADRLGLSVHDETTDPSEGSEETLIRKLLSQEIVTPEPDEAAFHRYWLANQAKFRSPDVYEAAHILFAAAADDKIARATARQAAMETLQQAVARPDSFAALAQQHSACPSGANGGLLGQQSRGDLVPEFETFIVALEEGQICPVPVQTRYGFHVLRLDRFRRGEVLPFETAKPLIEQQLRSQSWQRAVSQYLRILAGRAEISGIVIERASSPLVQ
jgi:peptidyl-prolyl cis-trans isomerase C